VSDHDPQLIFCDILMPRLDGYQTCAIIKRNPRFTRVPVIMLSSKDGLFDKARGRMVGSEDYLTKPFTKEQLLAPLQEGMLAAPHPMVDGMEERDYYLGKVSSATEAQREFVEAHTPTTDDAEVTS